MFYLNSEDFNSVPDSLFFLHKIGLLKHKLTDSIAKESLYFINNGDDPEIVWIGDTFKGADTQQSILIFDFVSASHLSKYKGHNLIVIPHVYFDYISTIKSISENIEINSFKIFSPASKNTTLIPKKHLMTTLTFLNDSHFANHFLELDSAERFRKKSGPPAAPVKALFYLFLKFVSDLLVFLLKPVTSTKLFFSKYTLKYIYGQSRVGLIKFFYSIYNFRFSFKNFVFQLIQLRFLIKSRLGALRVGFIGMCYSLINLRFDFHRLYHSVLNIRYPLVASFNKALLFRYSIKVALIRIFYALKHGVFMVLQLRYIFLKGWYFVKRVSISVYLFLRYNSVFTFIKYMPLRAFGTARVAFIKSFYYLYNLRFPLKHFAIIFFWLNFKYTFYPIRKIYWIVLHEFDKRILSKFTHAKKN